MVRQAIALFDGLGVETIIHCGDVGGMSVFDELVGRDCTFVWGNTDDPDPGLEAYVRSVGLTLPSAAPVIRTLGGKRAAIFHGHERAFEATWAGLKVDYVFHGHTHMPSDDRIDGVRVINPGALHRARRKSVATLDPEGGTLTYYEIPEQA